MTRRAALALAAAAAALVAFPGCSSDESRVRDRLDRLAASLRLRGGENAVVRGATIREAFGKGLTAHVEVSIPELPGAPSDPDGLARAAAAMSLRYRNVEVTIARAEVKLSEDRKSALVDATVHLAGTGIDGMPASQDRRTSFQLRHDGEWRVASVSVAERD